MYECAFIFLRDERKTIFAMKWMEEDRQHGLKGEAPGSGPAAMAAAMRDCADKFERGEH
ncbi:hypothetical protein [Acidocella sp.]|jgi:hypothetical protein|uniref:hypothetical protein n=1 Tax=Acidocella sp. TaxID=50710 RepID=UPI002F427DDE